MRTSLLILAPICCAPSASVLSYAVAHEPAQAPPPAEALRFAQPPKMPPFGAIIHYLEAGRGPVQVLLHGLEGHHIRLSNDERGMNCHTMNRHIGN